MEREQRPIAELIGWRRGESAGAPCWRHDDGRFLWAHERRGAPPDVSVDDLLDWASRRGWTLLNCASDRHGYRLCLEATGVVGRDVDGAGPTLYAAVEAAVRAVGGVVSEETP